MRTLITILLLVSPTLVVAEDYPDQVMRHFTIAKHKLAVHKEPKVDVDRSVLMSGQENEDEGVLVAGSVVRKPDLASGNRNGVELPTKASPATQQMVVTSIVDDGLVTYDWPERYSR